MFQFPYIFDRIHQFFIFDWNQKMSISLAEFSATKRPSYPSHDYTMMTKRLHATIDRRIHSLTENLSLKHLLDLSQFGLQEPAQVQYFLHQTALGRILLTLIGNEEALEEELLEEKWLHNIEQAYMDDAFTQFILYEAAKAFEKAKAHAQMMNAQSDYEPYKPVTAFPHIDHELNTALEKYEQTSLRLEEVMHYQNFLLQRAKALASHEMQIHRILSQHDLVSDLQQVQMLISEPDHDALHEQKTTLMKKLHAKRQLLIDSMAQSDNIQPLHDASKQIQDSIFALHNRSVLETLSPQLESAQTQQDFDAYFNALQNLYLVSNNEYSTFQQQLSSIFKTSNITLETQLKDFKSILRDQYCAREYLSITGEILSHDSDFTNAYYSKPTHLNLHYFNDKMFFVDKSLTLDFALNIAGKPFIDTDKCPVLAPQNSRMVKHNGQLYLLMPGQTIENMSEQEKERALQAAQNAKQATLSANLMAGKYLLRNKQFSFTNTLIEKDLEQCKADQLALRHILEEKQKVIEQYRLNNVPKLTPTKKKVPSLESEFTNAVHEAQTNSSPKLIPQKVLSLQARLKQLEKELNQDFKNKLHYDADKITKIRTEILQHLNLLPPEAQSIVFEKYSKILPEYSTQTDANLRKCHSPLMFQLPTNNDPLVSVKQQIELRNIVIYINKLLIPAPSQQPEYAFQPYSVPRPRGPISAA